MPVDWRAVNNHVCPHDANVNDVPPLPDRRLAYDIFLSWDDIALLRRLCHYENWFCPLPGVKVTNLVLHGLLQQIAELCTVTQLGRVVSCMPPSRTYDWVFAYFGRDVSMDALWDQTASEPQPEVFQDRKHGRPLLRYSSTHASL
ncbi:hypothetical protein [Planctomyces sp. SH-PL14]|uniref:hypothetical protein n=1 Tax=Planctomyces sp. SH-PL14 TaxID=1632864 RepID=UPI0009462035|nr:hypothetical protein [Planctomyces sp. SH-PL14]